MTKKTLSSFKELQNLLSEVKFEVKGETKKAKAKKTQNNFQQQSTENISKPLQKKFSERQIKKPKNKPSNNNADLATAKSIDPKRQLILTALHWLKTTFPKTFYSPPEKILPLKIGIGQDIVELMKLNNNSDHSLSSIRKALSMYTNNFRYLIASTKVGNARIDLDGKPNGAVTEEQALYAKNKLELQKQKRLAKQQALNPASANSDEQPDVVSQ